MAYHDVLQEGISLYNRKDYTGALSFFLSLPQDCGANPIDVAYYLGLCYYKLDRYDESMLYLEQVVTSGNENAESLEQDRVLQCRYLLAVIYCKSGRSEMADFELNTLLKNSYKTASVYASFAYIAWQQGNTKACFDYYEKALKADSENPTALNGMGYVLASENKDLTKALSLCKKALEKAPNSAACLDSLGFVYYKMGLYSQARKYLEQAKEIDGKNEVILKHLRDAELVEE